MPAHRTIARDTRPVAGRAAPSLPGARAAAGEPGPPRTRQAADGLSLTLARAVAARGATVAGPLLQRTPADAAAALAAAGETASMKLPAYKKWLKEKTGSGQQKVANSVRHGVGEADFATVVAAIGTLKAAGAAQKKLAETARTLQTALREAQVQPPGGVTLTNAGVIGYLDADQLPHQAKGVAIGTRVANKKKDSRFGDYADAAWHQANTLVTMTTWAASLGLADGETAATGQSEAREDNIHYEGIALRSGGQTYVFFHCYPGAGFVAS